MRTNGRTVVVACLALAGCAAWRGDVDPALDRRVTERLSRTEALPLEDASTQPPVTVEAALPKVAAEPPPELARPTPATGSRDLSIADVRAEALENNLDLEVALVDPRIAAATVSEEEARFDQLIFARARYAWKDLPATDGDLVRFKAADKASGLDGEIVKLNEPAQRKELLDTDLGIAVPLRTGGRFAVSAPLADKRIRGAIDSEQYRSALRFSVSQPLLRDAGLGPNVANLRIARYEQRIADAKTRLAAIRILAAVDRAYWALWAAWGELDLRRQQYQVASDNLTLVDRRVAEGLSAPIERNRAQIGVAERLEQLVVAATTLRLRQRQLKLLMNQPGLGVESTATLVPTTKPVLLSFALDPGRLTEQALAGRLELLELELKLAADAVKIDYLRNQTLPLFLVDYEYAGLGNDPGAGGAVDDAVAFAKSEWAVGLRIELPVSNDLREARLERAVSERLQRLSTRQLRELTVRREIHDALDVLEQNWKRILAARQNVVVAGRNYEAELQAFKEGLRTMTEVLEMLTRLGEAQSREIRAIADYQVAQIDLAFATGTLLGYGRLDLSVPPAPAPAR